MDRRSFLRLGSVAALGSLAGCSALQSPEPVTGSWPRPDYDAASSGSAPDNRGPTGTVDVVWRTEYTDGSVGEQFGRWAEPSDPVVADGRVYVAFDVERTDEDRAAVVLALDATTGGVRWIRELVRTGEPTSGLTGNSLVFADGLLYVGSSLGVDALDPKTGATEWRFEIPGDPLTGDNSIRTAPAVSGGTLYAGTADGTVYALDAASGEERWSTAVGDHAPELAVDGGVVYAAERGTVALDAETGAVLWQRSDGEYPALGESLYFTVDNGDRLVALDPADGSLQWETQPGSAPMYAGPAVSDGTVVVADMDAVVSALDAGTGERQWSTATSGKGEDPEIDTTPVVAGETVYVGNTAEVYYALDLSTGDVQWEYSDGDNNRKPRSPAVVDGRCFYAGYGSRTQLFAFDDCSPKIGGYCVR